MDRLARLRPADGESNPANRAARLLAIEAEVRLLLPARWVNELALIVRISTSSTRSPLALNATP